MDKLFIFILCIYYCLAKITIKNLDVPASIPVDRDEVVLDCEFDDQEGDVQEIKWFINGTVEQIYQWLPKRNTKPQALGKFKDIVDVDFRATKNTTTMYRAMKITSLSTDLSGDYTCKVSGDNSEDHKTKRMIIYDPADYDLELNVTQDDDDNELHIECYAEGIFPEPEMTLTIASYNETNIVLEDETEDTDLNDDGSYNVSSIVKVDLDDYESPVYYTCELRIPGTDYIMTKNGSIDFECEESEEDYTNLLNSTNTTDSSVEESQEFETQIEENSENVLNTTAVTKNNDNGDSNDDDDDDDDDDGDDDDDNNDNDNNIDDNNGDDHDDTDSGSSKHLPGLSLLTTLLLIILGSAVL